MAANAMQCAVAAKNRRSRRSIGRSARSLIQVSVAALVVASGLRRAFVGNLPTAGASALGPRLASSRPTPVQRKVFESVDTEWMSDPIVSCVGWTALLSGLSILRVATMKDESNTPKTFLQQQEGKPMVQPVVCLGDSLTRGNLSADWVSTLREQLGGGESAVVLNAGVNMECSTNIHQRLNEVIACKPSHVTVLIGTNDLKAELNPVEGAMYRVFGDLDETPSLEIYERTLVEIREKLREVGAKVAMVSPPVLGEEINSKSNKRAAEFAEAVKRVAAAGGSDCTYVPLFEQTLAKIPTEGGQPYCGFNFFRWCCLLTVDLYLRGRDLADVQRERKLGVTVDLVHLGPEMATQLATQVADFVRDAGNAEVPFGARPAAPRVALAARGTGSSRPVLGRAIQGPRLPTA